MTVDSSLDDRSPRGVYLRWEVDAVVRRMLTWLVSAEIVLVLLDAFVNHGRLVPYGPIRRLCNMAREDGLNTWFSSFQLAAVATVLTVQRIGAMAGARPRSERWGWTGLAGFFAYMAIDDAAAIHERVGSAFKQAARRVAGWAPHSTYFPAIPGNSSLLPSSAPPLCSSRGSFCEC